MDGVVDEGVLELTRKEGVKKVGNHRYASVLLSPALWIFSTSILFGVIKLSVMHFRHTHRDLYCICIDLYNRATRLKVCV